MRLWGGRPGTAAVRAGPCPIPRLATRTTRPAKRNQRTIAARYPCTRGQRRPAFPGEAMNQATPVPIPESKTRRRRVSGQRDCAARARASGSQRSSERTPLNTVCAHGYGRWRESRALGAHGRGVAATAGLSLHIVGIETQSKHPVTRSGARLKEARRAF